MTPSQLRDTHHLTWRNLAERMQEPERSLYRHRDDSTGVWALAAEMLDKKLREEKS